MRWLNYLRPDIKRGNISPDEEDLIIRLHRLLGNRYAENYWRRTDLLMHHNLSTPYEIINAMYVQVVSDSRTTAWSNGQRNQELLEHSYQHEAAPFNKRVSTQELAEVEQKLRISS